MVALACDEVVDNEDGKIVGEDFAETEATKIAPDLGEQTRLQVEVRRIRWHIPYRSWCRWFDLGRG